MEILPPLPFALFIRFRSIESEKDETEIWGCSVHTCVCVSVRSNWYVSFRSFDRSTLRRNAQIFALANRTKFIELVLNFACGLNRLLAKKLRKLYRSCTTTHVHFMKPNDAKSSRAGARPEHMQN